MAKPLKKLIDETGNIIMIIDVTKWKTHSLYNKSFLFKKTVIKIDRGYVKKYSQAGTVCNKPFSKLKTPTKNKDKATKLNKMYGINFFFSLLWFLTKKMLLKKTDIDNKIITPFHNQPYSKSLPPFNETYVKLRKPRFPNSTST